MAEKLPSGEWRAFFVGGLSLLPVGAEHAIPTLQPSYTIPPLADEEMAAVNEAGLAVLKKVVTDSNAVNLAPGYHSQRLPMAGKVTRNTTKKTPTETIPKPSAGRRSSGSSKRSSNRGSGGSSGANKSTRSKQGGSNETLEVSDSSDSDEELAQGANQGTKSRKQEASKRAKVPGGGSKSSASSSCTSSCNKNAKSQETKKRKQGDQLAHGHPTECFSSDDDTSFREQNKQICFERNKFVPTSFGMPSYSKENMQSLNMLPREQADAESAKLVAQERGNGKEREMEIYKSIYAETLKNNAASIQQYREDMKDREAKSEAHVAALYAMAAAKDKAAAERETKALEYQLKLSAETTNVVKAMAGQQTEPIPMHAPQSERRALMAVPTMPFQEALEVSQAKIQEAERVENAAKGFSVGDSIRDTLLEKAKRERSEAEAIVAASLQLI